MFREIDIPEEKKSYTEQLLRKEYSQEHLPLSKLLEECVKVISLYARDCPQFIREKLIKECEAWDLVDEEIEVIHALSV